MILSIALIITGFVGLIYGANWLVEGASSLAKKNNISDLVIGLTIVAFGTSAPELVVNSVAATDGLSDIVMGNIIGSNNFNLFIILGIASLVYPISVQSSTAKREIPISLIISLIVLAFANDFLLNTTTGIARWEAGFLLLLFAGFLYYIFKQIKTQPQEEVIYTPKSNYKISSFIIFGFIGLIVGGKLVVDNAIIVAIDLGVSQKIIGLTIIAAGTSLPELVTSVVAALKRNSDIAIGNVIGSNIFNILLILPISSLINPVVFNPNFNQDIWILIGGTVFLISAIAISKSKTVTRWQGLLLVGSYCAYTSYLISMEL